jgi:hypothetical protein
MRRSARKPWSASEVTLRAYYAWQRDACESRQVWLNELLESYLKELLMILTGWEVSKNADGTYRAAERKMGKEGYGIAVDQLTGHNLNGTLEEIHTQLEAWRMRPSKKLPNPLSSAEILEFWF